MDSQTSMSRGEAAVAALQPGDPDRVGAYRLLARLGTGGMGVVYLGRSPGGRAVAVKVVRERYAADFQFRARFRREVAAARSVTGGSTAVVLDADPEADRPWLVTAYLPGLTLREAVLSVGALPPATLRVLAAAVAEALDDIHRGGLVHRDLKPANVMVTADGVRVIDFGIARPEDATAITSIGTVVGTPGFMSPEQVSGAEVGPPSDVFSLGSVLMFAATGEEPFRSEAVAVTLHRVQNVETDLDAIADPWLRDLVAACLRADPARRPTPAELLDRTGAVEADAGWLPPALAEEIDRRAAQVASTVATVATSTVVASTVAAGSTDSPSGEAGHLGGPTIEPPALTAPLPRRRLLIGGLIGAAVAAAGGVAVASALLRGRNTPAGAPAAPAPTPSAGSPTPTTPPPAGERWRVKVSDFYPDELFTVAGIVLVRSRESELFALDAATGRLLWTLPASSLGTVSGGLAFQSVNINPELALVDPATGAARWKVRQQFPGDYPASLVVAGPVVAWGAREVRAQDLADGRTRWIAKVATERALVAVDGLLVAAGEAGLTALDASSGQVRWRFPVDIPWYLTAGAGVVFVVDRHWALVALGAADGGVLWQKPSLGSTSWPRLGGTTLYTSGGRGEVFALRPATGETLWRYRLDEDSQLEVSGDTVCAATANRTTYGLRGADGRLLWTYSGDVADRPVVMNCAMAGLDGQFYIGVREGYVVALAPPDGGRRAGS